MSEITVSAPRERHSHIWGREATDHYVEPAWCSERLFQVEEYRRKCRYCSHKCRLASITIAGTPRGILRTTAVTAALHVVASLDDDDPAA